MPYMLVDPETGFIQFRRTPQERAMAAVLSENQQLREANQKLAEDIASIKRYLNMENAEEGEK